MLPAFVVNLKNTVDTCDVYEGEAVRVLALLLNDGAKSVYQTYSAHEMSTNDHVYHGTWPMVINVLMHCFLAESVLQEAHYFVTRAIRRPDEY